MRIRYLFLITIILTSFAANAQKDLGRGFYDHGPTSTVAYQRGIVATTGADGKNVILSWLFDHRGGFGILMLDAATGKSELIKTPFNNERDAPYASILSKNNRYYTLFNGYFTEFDPVKKQFSFIKKTNPRAAMAMLEDKEGNIWAVTYPKSGLVKFSPETGQIEDYGFLYSQNWAQYPKYMAADNFGWIYIGVGTTNSQILAFDTGTEKVHALLDENERKVGTAYLFRAIDGKVYAKANNERTLPWLILEKGSFRRHAGAHAPKNEYIPTGNQNLFHNTFRDGSIVKDINFTEKYFVLQPKNDTARTIKFDYKTDGSWSLGITTGPDGKLYGGTAFPMQMFIYDPAGKTLQNFSEYSQLNTMMAFNKKVYSGGYPQGDLIEYTPGLPWTKPIKKTDSDNPRYLYRSSPYLNRPHRIKGLSDKNTIVLSGTPDYGHTGGGLLFWNIKEGSGTLLKDSSLILHHSTMSITELPGKKILCGTTVAAGTGGEVKAKTAALYIMDVGNKKVLWKDTLIGNAKSYNDLCFADNGIVYGFVNSNVFFAFDPTTKKMLATKGIAKEFEQTTGEQCQRIFVKDEKENIYVLFKKKIGKINQQNHTIELVAESPVEITAGGDYLNGYIYFISQSHICSYKIDG